MNGAERRLWLSVLVAALQDEAKHGGGYVWSLDFAEVCDLAEVSEQRVRAVFLTEKDRFRRAGYVRG
ncbi:MULTISPECIES: hypothetical protein [unclassified Mameliella]|uniref:hypothetical protein n=1 Tax=unclassified Mameliella TaxID=2630630 RepID=UPI00273EFE8D|nr:MULTISPECIES: hypothetical protein [unclassified Mameliella]